MFKIMKNLFEIIIKTPYNKIKYLRNFNLF